jgi:hypothetical protein
VNKGEDQRCGPSEPQAISLYGLSEKAEEGEAIGVRPKDGTALIAPGGDVIDGAGELDA